MSWPNNLINNGRWHHLLSQIFNQTSLEDTTKVNYRKYWPSIDQISEFLYPKTGNFNSINCQRNWNTKEIPAQRAHIAEREGTHVRRWQVAPVPSGRGCCEVVASARAPHARRAASPPAHRTPADRDMTLSRQTSEIRRVVPRFCVFATRHTFCSQWVWLEHVPFQARQELRCTTSPPWHEPTKDQVPLLHWRLTCDSPTNLTFVTKLCSQNETANTCNTREEKRCTTTSARFSERTVTVPCCCSSSSGLQSDRIYRAIWEGWSSIKFQSRGTTSQFLNTPNKK